MFSGGIESDQWHEMSQMIIFSNGLHFDAAILLKLIVQLSNTCFIHTFSFSAPSRKLKKILNHLRLIF